MISISENYLKKWRANSAQKILYCGNNLCLCRYGEQLIWRYKIRRKLSLKTLQTWRTIGIYPVINLKQAIEQATSINTMLNDGFNPKTYTNVKQHLNKTFNAVWQLFYLDHVIDLKPNSIKTWNKVMQYAAPINQMRINQICADDIHELINSCKSKSIAATLLQRIKQVFKWAKIKRLLKVNPLTEVVYPYKVGIVERYLSPTEIKQFFNPLINDAELEYSIRAAIYSLLILLIRKSELLKTRWSDVDLESGRVVIQNSKAIDGWIIKLPKQIIAVWQQLKELYPESVYVFERDNKPFAELSLNREIAKLITKYGTKKWTPHDLRRTGMTLLAEAGKPYEVIDAALGHVVKGVNRHYLKSNLLEERIKLLQYWADYIDKKLA